MFDTSVAIDLVAGNPALVERRRNNREAAFLSVISHVELIPGTYVDGRLDPFVADRVNELLDGIEVLQFALTEVMAYDRIIAAKGFSRRLVVDRMIAATALANDLTLATLNPCDFRDVPDLIFEDWSV